MPPRIPSAGVALALRLLAGITGSTVAGYLKFGANLFDPRVPQFQCITVGALFALMLALVRGARTRGAFAVAVGFSILQLGLRWDAGWLRAAAGTAFVLFLSSGLFVVALIFDRLAERGFLLGKMFVAGPLVGGVYLAVSPLSRWTVPGPAGGAFIDLFNNVALGVLIGYGVGLGIELVDLPADLKSRRRPREGGPIPRTGS